MAVTRSQSGRKTAPTAIPDEALARLRQAWGPVVAALVAAAGGNREAAAQLEPVLQDLAGRDDWRELAAVLRRVLAGERDPALLAGLDDTDTLIAGNALRALGVAHPRLAALPHLLGDAAAPSEPEASPQDAVTGLVQMVGAACAPGAPPQLTAQMHAATEAMANDGDLPDPVRHFGQILNEILAGDRDPDLTRLPPELARPIREMLANL